MRDIKAVQMFIIWFQKLMMKGRDTTWHYGPTNASILIPIPIHLRSFLMGLGGLEEFHPVDAYRD